LTVEQALRQASTMMLQAASFQKSGLRHAFFTREGGVSRGLYTSLNGGIGSNDAPTDVTENRSRMARALDVAPDQLLTLYQIHSPIVAVVEAAWPLAERPRADAMVTRRPRLALGVSTADCGPVLFADLDAGVVGAAHAGWRGALAGVTDATIAAMEGLGAARSRIVAAIGPMIRQSNYEVGAELREQFVQTDEANAALFAAGVRSGHFMFDLPGYIAQRLRAAGIGTIEDLGHCTYADDARFYSFRRSTHRGELDYGRHISAIALEG
jgi:YfiH family protein